MKFLNLGCGTRFCEGWTNVDFVSKSPQVMACNLLKGIPFSDGEFDVVYHSHVLEHFLKPDARCFIDECYRVLKPGGTIRVVVPDLGNIVDQYIQWRQLALQGDKSAAANYDWMMLEMYDQCVRQRSGGEMGKYLTQPLVSNEAFVKSRMGAFYDIIRKEAKEGSSRGLKSKLRKITWIKDLYLQMKNHLPGFLVKYDLGKFKTSGESHLWMYDSYSLPQLLLESSFKDARVCMPQESRIPQWSSYPLDIDADGSVYKKDSLYVEASK